MALFLIVYEKNGETITSSEVRLSAGTKKPLRFHHKNEGGEASR